MPKGIPKCKLCAVNMGGYWYNKNKRIGLPHKRFTNLCEECNVWAITYICQLKACKNCSNFQNGKCTVSLETLRQEWRKWEERHRATPSRDMERMKADNFVKVNVLLGQTLLVK